MNREHAHSTYTSYTSSGRSRQWEWAFKGSQKHHIHSHMVRVRVIIAVGILITSCISRVANWINESMSMVHGTCSMQQIHKFAHVIIHVFLQFE